MRNEYMVRIIAAIPLANGILFAALIPILFSDADPMTGVGRSLANPELIFIHSAVAASLLISLYFHGYFARLSGFILAVGAVGLSVHCLWYTGNLVTVCPLFLGGAFSVGIMISGK